MKKLLGANCYLDVLKDGLTKMCCHCPQTHGVMASPSASDHMGALQMLL